MTATDELRRMLTERGVEYQEETAAYGTLFTVFTSKEEYYFVLVRMEGGGIEMWSQYLTPEQAIAATLGAGTCHWEYPQGVNGWVGYIVCSNCQHQFSGVDEREWTCCPVCGARVEGADR